MNGLLQRHRDFWRRAAGRPLLVGLKTADSVTTADEPMALRLADGSLATEGMRLLPHMLSADRLHPEPDADLTAGPATCGDIFAVEAPYTTVPWMEAILGCPIRVGLASHSMWAEPALPEDWHRRPLRLGIQTDWAGKLLELTRHLVRNARGRYLVTHTLMRGPSDMAAALLGKEALCMAMVDHPQPLLDLLDFCSDVFVTTAKSQFALIPPFHDGYCGFYGVWAPGTCVRTQDDVSALYSARHCREFALPFQERVAASFDYSIIDLHSGSLHTAEIYAATEKIKAIGLSLDPPIAPGRVQRLLPALDRIMESKPLIVGGTFTQEEVDLLLSHAPSAGLCLTATVQTWTRAAQLQIKLGPATN